MLQLYLGWEDAQSISRERLSAFQSRTNFNLASVSAIKPNFVMKILLNWGHWRIITGTSNLVISLLGQYFEN